MKKLAKQNKNSLWRRKIFVISKYVFSILITILTLQTTSKIGYVLSGLLEIGIIFVLTNLILSENKIRFILGNIVNDILLFIYNVQMFILYFGGSYLSMIMLTNVDSLKDLSGNFLMYGIAVILALIFTFIPVHKITFPKRVVWTSFVSILACEVIFVSLNGFTYSTYYGLVDLYNQNKEYNSYKSSEIDDVDKNEFYQEEINDYRTKPDNLNTNNLNVVLIFTEGLSSSVMEDDRDLMPNLNAFKDECVYFDNYYNHSFATFRGLIGQLFSGHQLENYDKNNLVSIQSIFSSLGYNTAFINTEPSNKDFKEYLESFGFDKVISDKELGDSYADTMSDKDAYSLLFDTMTEMSEEDSPFFTSIYTFGTHVSVPTADEEFEDGSDDELNKFYNLDYQFGTFLKKFKESPMYDNTLLIFTTDHCTYVDAAYSTAFPDSERDYSDLDQIPLMFYYKGIEPEVIDVDGANSINLAPTLFDYLDISQPNYFLGTSLFASKKERKENLFASVFYDPFRIVSTDGCKVSKLGDKKKKKFVETVSRYFSVKEDKDVELTFTPDSDEDDSENAVDEGTYFDDPNIENNYLSQYYYNYYYYRNYDSSDEESVEATDGGGEAPASDSSGSSIDGGSTTPDSGGSSTDGGSTTPDSGGSTTPDSGGSTTPDSGGTVTPDSGGTVTPDSGGSTDVSVSSES